MIGNTQAQTTWQSKLVYYDNDKNLAYAIDSTGNRIPDFSYAGYMNGEVPIPDIPVVKTIAPVEGDNTKHIESALFFVALMEKDSNGFRGAVQLEAGIYEVSGTINMTYSGVVLRGAGDGDDPASNTILVGTNTTNMGPPVLVAGGGAFTEWRDEVSGSRRNIITDTVFVGENSFEVEDAAPYNVGDNIIIYHPCTASWLAAVDSGGTYSDSTGAEPGVDIPWQTGDLPIVYNRYIKNIEGNRITIDAPVFNHLIRDLSQSYIYIYQRNGLQNKLGIENLRIDINAVDAYDENHAWNAIEMVLIEDAWVRNCTMLHFGLSGVMTGTATRITVENCRAIDPAAEIEGGKRYNFNVYTASQLILFKNCHAKDGRHHYVSNGKSLTSGCVFVDCTSQGAFTSSEGHRRWSQGLLYDNHIELDGPRAGLNPRLLGLYNRGFYGTSHGWSAAHSVAWACDMNNGDLIVQKPPSAQNYAIGCSGKNITGKRPPAPFPDKTGYIEGSNQPGLIPRSLYLAQLEDRLGPAVAVETPRDQNVPFSAKLFQNYPNPFNPETMISFAVSMPSSVNLVVYDVTGRIVQTLVDGKKQAGTYQVKWIPGNQASGLYFYRLTTNSGSQVRKMIYIK